ncbi:hypothetical protein LIA77_06077 [Sarocladium implicatum]|nr:hypothetical protein LIA77_06077 [Sarocladium implicatum]
MIVTLECSDLEACKASLPGCPVTFAVAAPPKGSKMPRITTQGGTYALRRPRSIRLRDSGACSSVLWNRKMNHLRMRHR